MACKPRAAELMVQMQFHIRPFTVNDAVNTSVAQGLVCQRMQIDLVLAQYAIQLGT